MNSLNMKVFPCLQTKNQQHRTMSNNSSNNNNNINNIHHQCQWSSECVGCFFGVVVVLRLGVGLSSSGMSRGGSVVSTWRIGFCSSGSLGGSGPSGSGCSGGFSVSTLTFTFSSIRSTCSSPTSSSNGFKMGATWRRVSEVLYKRTSRSSA